MDTAYFQERKQKAKSLYTSHRAIYNPYLDCDVLLTSDGFRHLQFSARRGRERPTKEQLLRFSLLPLAFELIRRSATVQEYRRTMTPVGKPSARGEISLRHVEYWAFIAILERNRRRVKLRVVLRRIGTENVTFRSVMPYGKFRRGEGRLSTGDIEDE